MGNNCTIVSSNSLAIHYIPFKNWNSLISVLIILQELASTVMRDCTVWITSVVWLPVLIVVFSDSHEEKRCQVVDDGGKRSDLN